MDKEKKLEDGNDGGEENWGEHEKKSTEMRASVYPPRFVLCLWVLFSRDQEFAISKFDPFLFLYSHRLSRYLVCIRQLQLDPLAPLSRLIASDHLLQHLPRFTLCSLCPGSFCLTRKIRRAHGLRHLPTDAGRHKIRCRLLSWLSWSLGHRSFPIPIVTVQRCSIVLRLRLQDP